MIPAYAARSDVAVRSVSAPIAIPLGDILPLAALGGILRPIAIDSVGAEDGATSLIPHRRRGDRVEGAAVTG